MRLASHHRGPWLALLSCALALAGAIPWLYERRVEMEIATARRNLAAVADLKVDELVRWREERLGYAAAIVANPFHTMRILPFLESSAQGDKGEDIRAWLTSFRNAPGVRESVLIDAKGRLRLTSGPKAHLQDAADVELIATVLRTCQPMLSDFHRTESDGTVHLDLYAPLLRPAQPNAPTTCFGAVALVIDASGHLFPWLQSWPTPSATAETLLVKRDGDYVLFLNRLRHRSDPALTLRLPLSDANLPAAAAVQGRPGSFAGIDYRGRRVEALIRPVANSPWSMIAKQDREEILAPLVREMLLLLVFGCGALMVSGLGLVLWRMRREAGYLRANAELQQGRAAAQEALTNSQLMYRTLFDRAADGILVIGLDMRIIDANAVACERLQYSRQELLAMAATDFIAPESPGLAPGKLQEMLKAGSAVYESIHCRRDGTRFPVEVNTSFVEVDGVKAAFSIVRDFTARKKAAAELAAAERAVRLRADWAQGLQAAGEVLSACKTVEELALAAARAPRTSLGAMAALITVPKPEGGVVTLGCRSGGAAAGDPGALVCPAAVLADGNERAVGDVQATPGCVGCAGCSGCGEAGENACFYSCGTWPIFVGESIVATLTCRWQAPGAESPMVGAEALIKVFCRQVGYLWERLVTEERLRRLTSAIEQSPVSVVITNMHGRIEYVNPHFTALTGYQAAEVLGRDARLLQPDDALPPSEADAMNQALARGEAWQGELRNRKKNGQICIESASISPVRSENGEVSHYVAVKEDITRRKEVERELHEAKAGAEAASRAKSAFLANMSHEIRTPMNAVLGFTQVMMHDPSLTALQAEHLATINRAGEHLLALLNDILEISKIEAGRAALNQAPIGLDGLLTDMELLFRARAEAKGLRVLVERTGAVPPMAIGDEGKLRQVLSNLLSNAIKFTSTGGVGLRVASSMGPDSSVHLEFEVSDTGVGIAEDELPMLFQPFEQTSSGRQTGSGTGLGLAISRHLVRMMGGDIAVTSAPGRGSMFKFGVDFEEYVEHGDDAVPVLGRVVALSKREAPVRILVVDDNQDNCTLLVQMLGAVGFQVRDAAGGKEAAEQFGEWSPHLILMDLRLPDFDGCQAICAIRAAEGGSAVRIIAISASAFDEDRRQSLLVGADAFMGKPFREAELFDQVRRLLGVSFDYESFR